MIKAQLLNSAASLNDYLQVNALNFIPGENVTVAIQIFDAERNIRFIPPVAATLAMSFIDKDGNAIVKTGSVIDANDRSMWKVVLSQAESTVLAGQNVIVSLDVNGDAALIYKTLIPNGIIRNNLSGDC